MEFWGVDVKSGETLSVSPGDGMVIHLSQASIGEIKKEKGSESVCLYVNVDGKKFVLGTLFTDRLPQQQFDLVFDRDFVISHNWKSGNVYFYGYKAVNPFDDDENLHEDSEESESEEEDIPNALAVNGNSVQISKKEKPAKAEKVNPANDKDSKADKQKVKIVEPPKDVKPEEDDDSSDDDLMSEEDDDSEDEKDEDDSDDESDESDEETPKKVETSNKRPADSASKTPIPDKKAKATPQKTDGQKGGHVATPYPVKQAGKTPANKPNQQTPKSGGSHTCKPCNRTFSSDKALESHSKAKHGN